MDGSITQGTTLGLVDGFVFTFLPIVAIVLLLRWRRTWKTIVAAILIGVLLAFPRPTTMLNVIRFGSASRTPMRIAATIVFHVRRQRSRRTIATIGRNVNTNP